MGMDGDKCPWCGLEHRTYEHVSSGQSDQNGSKDVEGKKKPVMQTRKKIFLSLEMEVF